MAEKLPVDPVRLNAFGVYILKQFDTYKRERHPLEQQWMRNLRQYRGLNDPGMPTRPNGSTAYPKFTRKWVNGTVARMMQMLFPLTEKNWDIEPSEIPELGTSDLQALLNELQTQVREATGQGDLSDDTIKVAIMALAKGRCDKMRAQMLDQMAEMDYVALARKVVFSGVLYGTGLLSGPLIKTETRRSWKKDIATGRYVVVERQVNSPWFMGEFVWDWYPDLTAKSRASQDGHFFRRIMSRDQVRRLAERPDFIEAQVLKWLQDNQNGNYVEEYWELEVRTDGDRKYATGVNNRKYQLLEWWGYVSGHDLKAAGVAVPDDQLSDQHEANVWSIGNTVIKAILNPTESKSRLLHDFMFEEDDMNLTGVGLPQICRDSQLAIVEGTRMMLDNASVVCTPSKLIKMGLLTPNHPVDSRPYMDWYQDPDAPDNTQDAVKNLSFDSHIPELSSIIQLFKGIGEEEVSMPPIVQGDTSQGGSEGLRTQGNMSMALSGASLPIRDTVRNFDLFTDSAMSGLYDWNMEFNPDPSIKSDLNIITRGSTSLMAKEVRAGHFSMFAQTVQPEERKHVDWRKSLSERMKTIDLVPDEILLKEETVKENDRIQAEALARAQAQQTALADATIREMVTSALKNVSLAKKADSSADAQMYEAVMRGLDQIAQDDKQDKDQVLQSVTVLRDHLAKKRELDIREQEAETARQEAAKQPAAAAA